jgi:prevent-host-death family protein
MKVAIHEAKNNLSKYGNLANEGNKITVCKNGKPWFDLVPHETKHRSIKPLAKPTISASEAIAPVDPRDLAGWI